MNEKPDCSPGTEMSPEATARRDFLKKAGRFATVTPPTIALLLGTTLNSRAIAASTGSQPGQAGTTRQGNGFFDFIDDILGID